MKTRFLFLLSILLGFSFSYAQTWRYFEFTTQCGHGAWQDSSFIAATNNPELIDTVLANLSRPPDQRKFITGSIQGGNDGYNHNADHWFLWHFIPNQWNLAEMAIEVCDGCPFSDVDADTTYWIQTLGQFCPWSGRPAREISLANSIPYALPLPSGLVLQQNEKNLRIILHSGDWENWFIYDLRGNRIKQGKVESQLLQLSLPDMESGYYLLELVNKNHQTFSQKFSLDNH